ncbi:hypothetical protein [Streptomyces formicae]
MPLLTFEDLVLAESAGARAEFAQDVAGGARAEVGEPRADFAGPGRQLGGSSIHATNAGRSRGQASPSGRDGPAVPPELA